ncbi:DNA repair protein XRCC3-like isoform X2 [Lycorma delicatula]|uniref:DNA repair protein XRCC3-like isoform X2 n=1 Tax=Lycorma delicatula TaxID=130591 RepID=UPI003F5130CE
MGDINLEVLDSRLSDSLQKVSDMLKSSSPKWNRLSTGCEYINKLLRGGIPRRGITELSGESGSGKTQFCLQLTITVQLPFYNGGFNAGAVYICTEDKFPSPRLQQLFTTFPLSTHEDKKKLGDNVFIEHIADVDGLKQCVMTQLPHLLTRQSIGLVVIDSITAVFRADYDQHDMATRAKDLRTVGLQLHSLANQFHISVLCVNQVSSLIQQDNNCRSILVPALGLAWSNLVTTRLQMIQGETDNRALHVIFSPELPQTSCPYKISASGISGSETI